MSGEDVCTRCQCCQCRLHWLVVPLCSSVMVTMTVLPWMPGVCRRCVRLVPIQAQQQEEGSLREPDELGHLPPDQRHHHHWRARVRFKLCRCTSSCRLRDVVDSDGEGYVTLVWLVSWLDLLSVRLLLCRWIAAVTQEQVLSLPPGSDCAWARDHSDWHCSLLLSPLRLPSGSPPPPPPPPPPHCAARACSRDIKLSFKPLIHGI